MESIDREAVILRNRCFINTAKPDIPEHPQVHLGISHCGVGKGYKAASYMDLGYFYCPYMPLLQTPVVEDFSPNKGILSRYGRKLLEEGKKHYGKIDIENELGDR